VTVTGANGCIATLTVNVPLTGIPQITISQTNAACDGSALGSASASVNGNSPFTYQWSTSPVQYSSSVSNLSPGSYTLTVTDAHGCTNAEPINILTGGMQLSVSTIDLECGNVHNGSATVTVSSATAPFSYQWNTNPPQTAQTAINLAEGNYTVTVTDATGCTDTISAVVGGPPPIIINISTTNAGCTFSDGSATALVSGGHSPFVYTWNTNPVQHTATAHYLHAGIYHITVTDRDHCTETGTAYVSNTDGPQGFISNVKDATCSQPNGSATVAGITGIAPFSYFWNSVPYQYDSTATGLAAGIYVVEITDAEGCISFLNVKINAIPMGTILLDHITNASCGKEDGTATVKDSGGVAPFSFEWMTTPVQYGATATHLSAGTYLAILTDGNNCKDSLYAEVPSNKAHNDFNYQTGCLHEPAFFEGITDYTGSVSWKWNFGDIASGFDNSAFEQQASHIYSAGGNYTVTLYILGGCATDTLSRTILGAVKPEATFTYNPAKPLATEEVHFHYTGTDVKSWQWDFGDGGISHNSLAEHTFIFKNEYKITLYVTDEFGCRDTAEDSIFVDDAPAVFIPGSFTPNNDGKNDQFIIPSFGLRECDIKIFDRWGNLVFQCSNPAMMNTEGWNGTVNGSNIPEGSYAYIFEGKLENGKPVVREGVLNVLR